LAAAVDLAALSASRNAAVDELAAALVVDRPRCSAWRSSISS
jgi:hypothetical protein